MIGKAQLSDRALECLALGVNARLEVQSCAVTPELYETDRS